MNCYSINKIKAGGGGTYTSASSARCPVWQSILNVVITTQASVILPALSGGSWSLVSLVKILIDFSGRVVNIKNCSFHCLTKKRSNKEYNEFIPI